MVYTVHHSVLLNCTPYHINRELWAATNNTVGFNHMIASGPDALAYAKGSKAQSVALTLETMYQYTAYFADNDPREVKLHVYVIRSIQFYNACHITHMQDLYIV